MSPAHCISQVAYTHRNIWSCGFVLIGVIWPLLQWPTSILQNNRPLLSVWIGLCLVTAVFPMLDVNKTESLPTMYASSFKFWLYTDLFRDQRLRGAPYTSCRWSFDTFCQAKATLLEVVFCYSGGIQSSLVCYFF